MPFPAINPFFATVTMDGTERNLITKNETQVKHYQIMVGYDELAGAGAETLVIKVYVTFIEDSIERLLEVSPTVSSNTVAKIWKTYVSAKALRVTAQQTGGTFRDIQCEIHQI